MAAAAGAGDCAELCFWALGGSGLGNITSADHPNEPQLHTLKPAALTPLRQTWSQDSGPHEHLESVVVVCERHQWRGLTPSLDVSGGRLPACGGDRRGVQRARQGASGQVAEQGVAEPTGSRRIPKPSCRSKEKKNFPHLLTSTQKTCCRL
jgi:hypothetical protein